MGLLASLSALASHWVVIVALRFPQGGRTLRARWRALTWCHRAAPAVAMPPPRMGSMFGSLTIPAQALRRLLRRAGRLGAEQRRDERS